MRLNANADSAAVLAAAARARVLGPGSEVGSTTIVVLELLGGPIGPSMDFTAPTAMADFERGAVEHALAPLKVEWKNSPAFMIASPSLALSVPVIEGDRATVVANLNCGQGCSRTGIVDVRRTDGVWR